MKNFIKKLSTLFGLFLFVFFIALSTGCGDEKKDKNDDNDTDQTDNDNKDKNDDKNIHNENIVLKECVDSTTSRMERESKDTSVMAKMNLYNIFAGVIREELSLYPLMMAMILCLAQAVVLKHGPRNFGSIEVTMAADLLFMHFLLI